MRRRRRSDSGNTNGPEQHSIGKRATEGVLGLFSGGTSEALMISLFMTSSGTSHRTDWRWRSRRSCALPARRPGSTATTWQASSATKSIPSRHTSGIVSACRNLWHRLKNPVPPCSWSRFPRCWTGTYAPQMLSRHPFPTRSRPRHRDDVSVRRVGTPLHYCPPSGSFSGRRSFHSWRVTPSPNPPISPTNSSQRFRQWG